MELRYDAERHAVVIKLPKDLDASLFGEGEYTLEVLRGKLSRLKLKERDQEALAGQLSGETTAEPGEAADKTQEPLDYVRLELPGEG